jgi:hypothetical protein
LQKANIVYTPIMPIGEDNHRAKLHCNELLAMPLEMIFELSQSLALLG